MSVDRCVICGEIIPEGRMVCYNCEKIEGQNDKIMEMGIKLETINDIGDFINLSLKCQGEVLVYSGRYIVSGKSIMGMYSLDLSKPVKVRVCGEIPNEVKEEMKKYIVD